MPFLAWIAGACGLAFLLLLAFGLGRAAAEADALSDALLDRDLTDQAEPYPEPPLAHRALLVHDTRRRRGADLEHARRT
jgi:hypothetical protein